MLELVYILQAFTSHVLNSNKVVALLKKYYLCLNHLFKKNTLCKIGWCSLLCYKIFATTSIFKNLYFPALSFNKVLLQTNNGKEITFAFALVVFKCAL